MLPSRPRNATIVRVWDFTNGAFLMALHEIAGQGFTHQYLWNCAELLLSQEETKSPKDGYFLMTGMLMAYFTYEAYLNLVGPHIDGGAWKKEREFFSKPPYQGTVGKLTRICEKLGMKIDRGQRPYQTIRELQVLRDFLAHGKPDVYAYEIEVEERESPDMFKDMKIYEMVTREKADRALKDTEEFLECLRNKIVEKLGDDELVFRIHALQFPLASASGGEKPR
jgi:hypothetical protein